MYILPILGIDQKIPDKCQQKILTITVEIMKTIDEREMQNTTNEKQTKTERSKGNRSYSKTVKAKLFSCAFKLEVFSS